MVSDYIQRKYLLNENVNKDVLLFFQQTTEKVQQTRIRDQVIKNMQIVHYSHYTYAVVIYSAYSLVQTLLAKLG